MTASESRTAKLFPALTAKERAILLLQAWKRDEDEDPLIRRTMPSWQVAEFNRYIASMNVANRELASYVLFLRARVDYLRAKQGWLASLTLWGLSAWRLGTYIFTHAREPIAESEYRKLEAEARAEMVPVDEFAEFLVERHEGWSDDDREERHGNQVVKDEAWSRVCSDKQREILARVRDGTVNGTLKGKKPRVNAGSFYDWLGEPVPLYPNWGLRYEVVPDEKYKESASERRSLSTVREQLREAPTVFPPERFGATRDEPETGDEAPVGDRVAAALKKTLVAGIVDCWRTLQAIEQVTGEIAEEFDGEDPRTSQTATLTAQVRDGLLELAEERRKDGEPLELEEPSEDEVDALRKAVDSAVRLVA